MLSFTVCFFFFFSSRRRHTRCGRDWSSDVCSSDLALLSLPAMGYWALFRSHEQPYLRHARFAVAMGGVAALAFVVFLKQHLLDQKLLHLLKHSRGSFNNLQRLQGRVIQQAKLASLGELVALAAGELEVPLSAILSS